MLNQLQAMRVFLSVAENNSFSRAAASLDISNAVVTRYVALLERHLNARLLNRTTRSLSLTEAGHIYARGCRQLLDLVESMESTVATGLAEPSGTLKIAATASFSLAAIAPLLHRYRLSYPKVKLDITLLHQSVDFVEKGFDVGIVSSRHTSGNTYVKRPLFSVRPVVVASRGYVDQHGAPATLEHLQAHNLLSPSRDLHGPEWTFVRPDGHCQTVNLEPMCTVNDMIMLRQMVFADMGVAIVPEEYVADDLARGQLVQLLPRFHIDNDLDNLSIVYSGRFHLSAKVRTFVDFAVEYFRSRSRHPTPSVCAALN
jgi:DNA-binding transcriptional LysR family regulator